MSWNRPKDVSHLEKRTGVRFTLPVLRGAVAALIVVAGAIAAWLVFPNGEADSSPLRRESARSAVKAVTPSGSGKKAAAPSAPSAVPSTTNTAPARSESAKGEGKERLCSALTNGTGHIIERVIDKDGKPLIRVREMPSIWKFHTDGMLAQIAFMADDEDTPPFPPMDEHTERTFLKSLESPIELDKNDSHDIRCLKIVVASLREEIKERMKDGETFAEILEDHRQLVNHNNRLHNNAEREYRSIRDSGDKDGAETYKATINAALQKMGIDPIGDDDEGDE